LPKEREHFKIKLNGVGLHCGKGIMIDKEDKLHGEVYNVAYRIGEDLCEGGQVFITEDVKNRL